MEAVVETQGKCLFCLEKVEHDHDRGDGDQMEEEDLEPERFSLRHIFHYLQLKLKSNQLDDWDYSVLLCRKCGVLAERLTELCRQLELVQMKVDYLVEELFLVITLSGLPSEDFVRSGGDREDGLSGFASLLRERTRKRATAALDRSRQPQIKLRKVDDEENDDFQMEEEALEDPLYPTVELSDGEEEWAASPAPVVACNSALETETAFSGGQAGQGYSCPFCSKVFRDQSKLKFHTTGSHLEQFFSTARLPGISEEAFQFVCHQQMRCGSDGRLPNGFYKCSFCPTAYKERRRVVCHIVDKHHDEMTQKIQESLKQKEAGTYYEDKGDQFSCDKCHRKFTQFEELALHWKSIHQNQSQIISASKNMSLNPFVEEFLQNIPKIQIGAENRYICGYCPTKEGVNPTIILHNYVLKRHVLQVHTEMLFMSIKKPEVSMYEFKNFCQQVLKSAQQISKSVVKRDGVKDAGEVQKLCYFCSSMFTDPRTLQRHQTQIHFDDLKQELEKLQEANQHGESDANMSKTRKCAVCEDIFSNIFEVADHMQKEHNDSTKVLENTLPQCPNCSVYFSCQATLTQHKVLCAAGQYSQNTQLDNTDHQKPQCLYCDMHFSSTTNLNRHLRENCSVIKGQIKGSTNVECKVCGATFGSSQALGGHLSRKHPSTVREQVPINSKSILRPKCPNCYQDFATVSNLDRHLKENCEKLKMLGLIHHKPKPREQRTCPYCNLTLYDRSNLNRHIRLKHPGMAEDVSTTEDETSNLSIDNVTSLSAVVKTDDRVNEMDNDNEDHEYQMNITDFLDVTHNETEDSDMLDIEDIVPEESITFHSESGYDLANHGTEFSESDPLQF